MSQTPGAPRPYAPQQPAYQQQPYPQPGYYPQPVYVVQKPMSGLAVASLVLSLVWFFGLASLVAVLLAFPAMKEAGPGGPKRGQGLAVTGMILGFLGAVPMLLWGVILVFGLIGSASS